MSSPSLTDTLLSQGGSTMLEEEEYEYIDEDEGYYYADQDYAEDGEDINEYEYYDIHLL